MQLRKRNNLQPADGKPQTHTDDVQENIRKGKAWADVTDDTALQPTPEYDRNRSIEAKGRSLWVAYGLLFVLGSTSAHHFYLDRPMHGFLCGFYFQTVHFVIGMFKSLRHAVRRHALVLFFTFLAVLLPLKVPILC